MISPQSSLVPTRSSNRWTPPRTRATSQAYSSGASAGGEDFRNGVRGGALSPVDRGSDPRPNTPHRPNWSSDLRTTGTIAPGFELEPQCEGIARDRHRTVASNYLRYSPDVRPLVALPLELRLTLEPGKTTRTAPTNRTAASKDRILEFDGNIINSKKWFQSQSSPKRRRARRK